MPTQWSMAWNVRWAGGSTIGSALTKPGRYGPSYPVRSTRVCRVCPYVAIAARTTVPCSSFISYGSSTERAPCSIAYAYALRASGTSMARSITPSPCSATCSARKWPQVVAGLMTEVRTKRAEPLVRTYEAVSRRPFSGPE